MFPRIEEKRIFPNIQNISKNADRDKQHFELVKFLIFLKIIYLQITIGLQVAFELVKLHYIMVGEGNKLTM